MTEPNGHLVAEASESGPQNVCVLHHECGALVQMVEDPRRIDRVGVDDGVEPSGDQHLRLEELLLDFGGTLLPAFTAFNPDALYRVLDSAHQPLGWAGGDVKACVRECADLRLYERGGEPSAALIGQLECLAGLACEELPAAVQGSERGLCAPEPVDFDSAGLREE